MMSLRRASRYLWSTCSSFPIGASLYAAITLLFHTATVGAQTGKVTPHERHCDPSVRAPGDHPLAYRLRTDRCEGIYFKEVASTTLTIASLTESFVDFDPSSTEGLTIDWKTPGTHDVYLRASALKRRTYYRMDTVRPTSDKVFRWPLSVLAALGLSRKTIGVVGWTEAEIGDTRQIVYLPIRVSQHTPSAPSGRYRLIVIPGRELEEVFLSTAAVRTDGSSTLRPRDSKALQYGYYPADRPITIPIENLVDPGFYFIEIGGTVPGGGTVSTEFWLYHPGV